MITLLRAILKFFLLETIVITGKLLAYVWTPIIFPLRFYGMNAVHNWAINNADDDWKIKRLDQWSNLYKDGGDRWIIMPKYMTSSGGWLMKRNVSHVEALLAFVFIYVWVDPDADLDVTSKFIAVRDYRITHAQDSPTAMMADGYAVDFGARLETHGGYWLCGDRMRENKVSYFKTFKAMYEWTVIRNGFYGFNYTILESWIENFPSSTSDWDVKKIWGTRRRNFHTMSCRLKTDLFDGERFVNRAKCIWGHEFSTSRLGDKCFFMLSGAWVTKSGDKYTGWGYEFGWRRFGSQVIRFRKVKAVKYDYLAYKESV